MARKAFNLSWVGVYKSSSNSYYKSNTPIAVGGSPGYNSFIGIPSSVKDALKTSKTTPKMYLRIYITSTQSNTEFAIGGHKETYNKAKGTMPWYRYLGYERYSKEKVWKEIDLTSRFKNSYLNGTYTGIVIYGQPGGKYGEAYGKTGDSNQAQIIVEGTWNTDPKPPGSISNPKSSTIADNFLNVTWTAGSDAESPASQLKYELQYYNGSRWIETWTVGSGVLNYNYPLHDKPETSRAQFRIRTVDPEGLKSGWITSPYFTVSHNRPPLKPTNLRPNGGAVIDRESPVRFTWKHNDDGAQAGFRLFWRTVSETGVKGSWNYIPNSSSFVNSTNQYYDFQANVFPKGEIEWTVKTVDQQSLESPLADYERFYAGEISNAPVWLHPKSGDIINESQIVAQWSSLDQVEYEIRLENTAGDVLWSEQSFAGNKSTLVGYTLENATTYILRVRHVSSDSGLWSNWSDVTFTTQFVPPSKPKLTVKVVNENGESLDNALISWETDRNKIVDSEFKYGRWTYYGNESFTIEEDTDGTKFARVTVGADRRFYGIQNTDSFTLEAGATYKLTYQARSNQIKNFNYAYIMNANNSNQNLSPSLSSQELSEEWTEVSCEFVANVSDDSTFMITIDTDTAEFVEGDYIDITKIMLTKADEYEGYVEGSQTSTEYVRVFRREYNAMVNQPWVMIADNQPPNSSIVDYSPASLQIYEYMIQAWGNNRTYTESDVVEVTVVLNHSFLQRAANLSDMLVMDIEERSDELDFGGKVMYFANRVKPVFEHEIQEDRQITIKFMIPTVPDFRNALEFFKRRETFLYRDVVGRKLFCVLRNPKVTDQTVSGFEIELTLVEVDYTEEV